MCRRAFLHFHSRWREFSHTNFVLLAGRASTYSFANKFPFRWNMIIKPKNMPWIIQPVQLIKNANVFTLLIHGCVKFRLSKIKVFKMIWQNNRSRTTCAATTRQGTETRRKKTFIFLDEDLNKVERKMFRAQSWKLLFKFCASNVPYDKFCVRILFIFSPLNRRLQHTRVKEKWPIIN